MSDESKSGDNNAHDKSRRPILPSLTNQNPKELEVNDDNRISELLHELRLTQNPTPIPPRDIQQAKSHNYHFWSKEPVPELGSFLFSLHHSVSARPQ